ncbi:Fur family transcriptional regulator [Algihabitans albus]|uniref:Fur family transcriptional regulator n=1 Tax=Algihabitans albus TaxID=2164067 RepID=UPI001F1FC565|nr:transcriptional repressor [Algihabitans albus]
MTAARPPEPSSGETPHSPKSCHHELAEMLTAAELLCSKRGRQLTALRRRVLELIAEQDHPVGAYELIDRLTGERGRTAPPTVYRTLEFLQAEGLVHRIESLNAFVACPHPDRPHATQFFICKTCGATAELHDQQVAATISEHAARSGFTVDRQVVEVTGRCTACQGASAGSSAHARA